MSQSVGAFWSFHEKPAGDSVGQAVVKRAINGIDYVCPDVLCGRILGSRKSLDSHEETFHRPVVCYLCPGLVFRGKIQWRRHMAIAHGDREPAEDLRSNPLVCRYCGKGLSKQANLHAHIRSFHSLKKCPFCPLKMVGIKMRKHLVDDHGDREEVRCGMSKCEDCGKMLDEKHLPKHKKLFHEKRFCCQCRRIFWGQKDYEKHKKMAHGKSIMEIRQEEALEQEAFTGKKRRKIRTFLPDCAKFHCLLCNFKCLRRGELDCHRRESHKGTGPKVVSAVKEIATSSGPDTHGCGDVNNNGASNSVQEDEDKKNVIEEMKKSLEPVVFTTFPPTAKMDEAEEDSADLFFDPLLTSHCQSFARPLIDVIVDDDQLTFLEDNHESVLKNKPGQEWDINWSEKQLATPDNSPTSCVGPLIPLMENDIDCVAEEVVFTLPEHSTAKVQPALDVYMRTCSACLQNFFLELDLLLHSCPRKETASSVITLPIDQDVCPWEQ